MKNPPDGFTLIEFMVAISIVIIIAMVAIPGFSNAMRGSDVTAAANELIGGINLARMEALRRGYPVILCSLASNNQACADTTTWSNGVLIWRDNDSNGSYSANFLAPEQIGMIHFSADSGVTVSINPEVAAFQFDSQGRVSQNEIFCITKQDYSIQVTLNTMGIASKCVVGDNNCNGC